MARIHGRRVSIFIALAGALSLSSVATAAPLTPPPFCPAPAAQPPVCAGHQPQVGDLLIAQHGGPPLILGLNPATGYYVFSAALTSKSELGDILVEPTNPFRSVVIGDVSPTVGIGIVELDECGALSNPNFGVFSDVVLPVPGNPVIGTGGINNRGMIFSPTTNVLWSDGDSFLFPQGTLFSFPPGGGGQTVLFTTGDVANGATIGPIAADETGAIYVADQGIAKIVKYTAATLATTAPVGVALAQTSLFTGARDMVYDGNGSLFVTGGASGDFHVWKVNATTGATTVFTSDFGAALGGAPLSQPWGVTIDTSGDLWVVFQDAFDPTMAGVGHISHTTGQVVQFFPLPSPPILDGQPLEPGALWTIAVWGENLPAVRKHCALFPTVHTAIDAATGPVVWNPPGLSDSYRSCLGPYGGANVAAHGDVQAAQAITVNGGAINGARIPNTPSGFVPVPVPAGLTSSGDLNVNNTVTLTSGDYLFGNVNINSGGTLRGSGGLVRIWFRNLNVSSTVAAAGNLPANLWLFGLASAGPVNVNSNATVTGVIDSPNSPVFLSAQSRVFGSVIGSQVTGNGGVVHFDEVLGGATCP